MHPAAWLQWGQAARFQHPLLTLLTECSDRVSQIDRLAHPGAITAVAAYCNSGCGAGSGHFVLSADDEGRLRVWALRVVQPASLTRLATHALHSAAINCLELHTCAGLLATAGDDGCVRLWRTEQLLLCSAGQHGRAQAACLAAHGAGVTAVAFSSSGAHLASASRDGTVRLWHVGAREPLAVLQLQASSVAFVPGDDAALLVATMGLGPADTAAAAAAAAGPLLLDLRRIPACQLYVSQLAAVKAAVSPEEGVCGRQAAVPAALHPAAVVWLPSRPRQLRAATGQAAPPSVTMAATPGQQEGAQSSGPPSNGSRLSSQLQPQPPQSPPQQQLSGGTSGSAGRQRQAGTLATFSRRQRSRQEAAVHPGRPAVPAVPGVVPASPASWLPPEDDHMPLQPPAAPTRGGSLFGGWMAPLSPTSPATSPLAAAHHGAVPASAVAARYQQPCRSSSSGGEWDPRTRQYVYRQGGHSTPVHWAGLLPGGLHVLTAAADGEAKLWLAAGGGSSGGGDASSAPRCTLLPPAPDRRECGVRCRPAVSACRRYVVCGGPRGALACWDLQQLQRTAHLPLDHKNGNAAAACRPHSAAVTAVHVSGGTGGDTVLVSGDAGGRLVVRWG